MSNDTSYSIDKLSSRECDILKLLAQGFSNAQIAKMLNLSPSTVSTHRRSIQAKLHITNLAGIIRYALKFKLIS